MDIDFAELRRQSKIAAALTAVSSCCVVGSLFFSYKQNVQANLKLKNTKEQIQQSEAELQARKNEVSKLRIQAKAYRAALNDVVSNNGEASATLTKTAESSPNIAQSIPRVFVHMRENADPEIAGRIANDLRTQGFIVPAPDKVFNNIRVPKAEVVFFQQDGSTDADGELIVKVLQKNNVPPDLIWRQQDFYHQHPPRTYAIYLSMLPKSAA